ncbi:MAG TPA: Fic family protein [Gammaproteobacteria bacterium]|jgi:Fic family protein|nr:Fic family protein [Gammaproteobacteria bacterium]
MTIKYNWQQADWPHFRYDLSKVYETLFAIAEKIGLITGKLSHLTENLQTETMINLMVEEAVKTSKIEGENISRPDIRSSIKNKLGLNQQLVRVHDKRASGIAELLLDVRHTFQQSLTEDKLFDWHLMLLSGSTHPDHSIGCWRTGEEPMQIVSGHYGQFVHYEAPPAGDVPKEMERFIHWFNQTAPGKPQAIKFAPVRAAIAHLYFESIHPFEDGNGRMGRVIAEKALSQGFGYPVIFSLSKALEAEKKDYYAALHVASKSNELTAWIAYFVSVVLTAQIEMETEINFIIKKSIFFDKFEAVLNERQLKVVRRMLQAGTKGFIGGMSAKKYMVITGSSKATATRDLQHLVKIQALKQTGSGRSVHYELNLFI